MGVLLLNISVCLSYGFAQTSDTITIDGQSEGRVFQGIGAVSAGASSRLLYDYPEPERSQILDYLFKPDYGAALQILKVEIGGDMNSTDGSEASHMRSPSDLDCNRGYEWWLMKEAKKRNPNIKLAGLAWGAPGWVGDFWSKANIDYHLAWLGCAEQHGLQIDYMGGWNERGYDVDWFIEFDQALEQQYPNVELIGADDCCSSDLWRVVDDMNQTQAFKDAVDIVGVHFACGHRNDYGNCESPEKALALDKPLWMSENSALNHDVGAMPIARALNRMYIDARLTGYMSWSAISAWYANLPIADTGLMLAEWPWSGYYQVGKSPWAYAHTTQFTEPGWNYINSASGYLSSGASYVTLQPTDSSDYTMVIEAIDATQSQTVEFSIAGGLPADKMVQVWATNLRSDNPGTHFVHMDQINPEAGKFQFTLQPGYLYTLSTTTGQSKGAGQPAAGIAEQMPLPFQENFEGYGQGKLARYFSDINGAFETVSCGRGRGGSCYRQMITQQPIVWNGTGNMPPTTIVGDPRWWGDYEVSADVLLEQPGYVELISRISAQRGLRVAGYHLQVSSSGRWELYRQDLKNQQQQYKQVLASGNVSFGVGEWHRLALNMQGPKLTILIDGEQVKSIEDSYYTTGQIGLRASSWKSAQFDNVKVTRNGDWPVFVPKDNIRATATSDHPENYGGYDFTASNAIDGRPETAWHTEWAPKAPLPQSVTLDLGGSYNVQGLTYQPRLDDNQGGMITKYNIYVSTNGAAFENVASGTWPTGTVTKTATWEGRPEIRYVRLEAIDGVRGGASAGEINIATKNLSDQTGLSDSAIRDGFKLKQNFPNPFNFATTIEYSIPKRVSVSVRVYDILGRIVTTLVDEEDMVPATYEISFDAAPFSSGMYFYRIKAGDFVETKKLILVK